MIVDKYPKFSAGRVLKHDMLSLLCEYPRDYVDMLYKDYADGVLAGCSITVNPDTITINPALIRFHGKILKIQESINLSYTPTGQDAMVKIILSKEKESNDFFSTSCEMVITSNMKVMENEMELCRFKLKPGARLRDDYQNFADLATEYDTLNIINMPFAAPFESTIAPIITRRFATEALASRLINAFDYTFVAQCAQGKAVARTLLTAYTSARLGVVGKDSTNQDIHRHLARILSDIRQGKDMATVLGRSGGRRILVD